MKRIWIAFALLATVVVSCVWSQVTVRNFCYNLTSGFDDVMKYSEKGDYENAGKSADEIKKQWEKYYARISAFKNHEDLHDLMIDVNMVHSYLQDRDAEKILEVCRDAVIRLEHIKDGEKISFGNIF